MLLGSFLNTLSSRIHTSDRKCNKFEAKSKFFITKAYNAEMLNSSIEMAFRQRVENSISFHREKHSGMSPITFLFCLEIRKDLTNMYDGKPPRRRYPNYHSSKSKISVNQTNSPQTPESPLVKKQVTKIISICPRVLLKIAVL